MSKWITGIAFVIAVAFFAAAWFQPVEAAFSRCSYRCICSVPNKCCTSGGVTTCKPDPKSPLQCPQVAC